METSSSNVDKLLVAKAVADGNDTVLTYRSDFYLPSNLRCLVPIRSEDHLAVVKSQELILESELGFDRNKLKSIPYFFLKEGSAEYEAYCQTILAALSKCEKIHFHANVTECIGDAPFLRTRGLNNPSSLLGPSKESDDLFLFAHSSDEHIVVPVPNRKKAHLAVPYFFRPFLFTPKGEKWMNSIVESFEKDAIEANCVGGKPFSDFVYSTVSVPLLLVEEGRKEK